MARRKSVTNAANQRMLPKVCQQATKPICLLCSVISNFPRVTKKEVAIYPRS